jgi:hypothetical protein
VSISKVNIGNGSSSITVKEAYEGSGFDPGALYIVVGGTQGTQCFDPLSNGPATFQVSLAPSESTVVTMWIILGEAASNSSAAELSSWTLQAPVIEVGGESPSGDVFGSHVVVCDGTPYIAITSHIPTSLGAGPTEQTCQPAPLSDPAQY